MKAALPPLSQADPNILIGTSTADDAGVYRISDDVALVQTVDFITPPVDDPRTFGRIAAANSLSDVYAMGGVPKTALNVVCFPSRVLPLEMLREILVGGSEVAALADTAILGGHSVRDNEPKYGMSVTGLVHPDRIWGNVGAMPGDALILTKALGTGVLFNANRAEPLPEPHYRAAVESAARLNRWAAEAVAAFEVHAATDVTGFGLAGHTHEMAQGQAKRAQAVRLRIDGSALPFLPGAVDAYERGFGTGANKPNQQYADEGFALQGEWTRAAEQLLYDPQTSGGLLLALPASRATEALARIRDAGDEAAAIIGSVEPAQGQPGVTFIAPS